MAVHGQRFELNLESDNWQFDVNENEPAPSPLNVIKGIKERESSGVPAAPTLKSTKTGFPEHRTRRPQSAFKQQKQTNTDNDLAAPQRGPSDRAILHHAAKKHGVDLASAKQQADIDAENRSKISQMSMDEIEQARAELMAQFKPNKLQAFLQRANVNDEHEQQQKEWDEHEAGRSADPSKKSVDFAESSDITKKAKVEDEVEAMDEGNGEELGEDDDDSFTPHQPPSSTTHFPAPPRNKSDYKPLDPNSESFLSDLKEHYFPDLPHDPSTLSWLQDPTETEQKASSYNPDRTGFAPSALRFGFNGMLIPPSESLDIPTSKGLHHHGDAPSSAGYSVPELALLARSTLASQRSVSYQVMGRILFRLGRGDFGPRGHELSEGLWTCIERERVVEVIMAEANRDKGHVSAQAYATEALWLWRRGGGGDRGVLKESETRAK
ncbi:hypothetical protein PMZ80_005036 [Knufia obscura]|uniref:RNA polymerase II-associated protein RBA50 n=2 Tax=Knufia TaxID=430999 RepID=A0AAN8ES64_9EURO|nr:hypothetical protein PMZ80_005036 [Knufia obscura]KAK5957698.1 hypothetical protein OHC33_000887 [Knufia fluminis]